jgi:2,3-bisphosphoglycerate-independent phosphoglycerate mutase
VQNQPLPIESLGGKTPIQVAATPNLDRLAKRGVVGRMQNTPPGFKAGSDVCNLSLLGYDCSGFYSGRAPYEAASMGIVQEKYQVVFRNLLESHDLGPPRYDDLYFAKLA